MRPSSIRRQPAAGTRTLEHARVGYHKIVADILRHAPAEDAARIAWQMVAGSKVAPRTSVLSVAEGVLTVRVPDTTWRTQLAEFVPQYLVAMNSMLPEQISKIELVTEEKKPAHRA